MKRARLLAAMAVVAMFMTSCEIFGEDGPDSGNNVRFVAYIENGTRTTIGSENTVLWSEDDAIALFGVVNGNLAEAGTLTISDGAGTQTGVFKGELAQKYDNYYSYYPADKAQGVESNGLFVVEYPNVEAVYTEKNFVDGANPMVATGSESDGLQFKNLCGILDLRLTGSGSIEYITIEVGDDDPKISGQFVVDAVACEAEPYQAYNYISARLATPVQLSSDSSCSIYAIMPPGEYQELRVTTYDNAGNATTRIAKNPITIKRSTITSVSGFDHQTVQKPHITATYLEEKSNFAIVTYRVTLNNLAVGAVRFLMTESYYNTLVSQGMTDSQIIQGYGTTFSESGDYSVNVQGLHGQNVVFLFAAYDEQGEWGDIQKLEIRVKDIPIEPSYSVTIRQTPTVTNSGIEAYFDATPAEGVFCAYLAKTSDLSMMSEADYEIYTACGYGYVLTYGGSEIHFERTDLEPNTDYTMIYRVANGVSDGVSSYTFTNYSEYKIYSFKTEAYEYSNASVNLSVADTKDWSIKVGLSGANASKYKLYLTTSVIEDTDIESSVNLYGSVEVNATTTEHTFTGLTENTTYYIYAIAYDANGVYGRHSVVSTTTTNLIPETNSEYDKFLGTYTFTSSHTSADAGRTVTITKAVEGKTFYVKGLLNPVLFSEQYGIVDDTLEARFYDNMIHVGGGAIADKGTVLQADYVFSAAYSPAGYLWPGKAISSNYNNGTLTFACLDDPGFTGLFFHLGNTLGNLLETLDYYSDLVLIKQGAGDGGSNGNSTEGFDRNDSVVDAGWK